MFDCHGVHDAQRAQGLPFFFVLLQCWLAVSTLKTKGNKQNPTKQKYLENSGFSQKIRSCHRVGNLAPLWGELGEGRGEDASVFITALL